MDGNLTWLLKSPFGTGTAPKNWWMFQCYPQGSWEQKSHIHGFQLGVHTWINHPIFCVNFLVQHASDSKRVGFSRGFQMRQVAEWLEEGFEPRWVGGQETICSKPYCWWFRNPNTPVNHGKYYLSTGAGFLPSTVFCWETHVHCLRKTEWKKTPKRTRFTCQYDILPGSFMCEI